MPSCATRLRGRPGQLHQRRDGARRAGVRRAARRVTHTIVAAGLAEQLDRKRRSDRRREHAGGSGARSAASLFGERMTQRPMRSARSDGWTPARCPASPASSGRCGRGREGDGVGLRDPVEDRHANPAGLAHGGLVSTLADHALSVGRVGGQRRAGRASRWRSTCASSRPRGRAISSSRAAGSCARRVARVPRGTRERGRRRRRDGDGDHEHSGG